jgi:hypothetical protein
MPFMWYDHSTVLGGIITGIGRHDEDVGMVRGGDGAARKTSMSLSLLLRLSPRSQQSPKPQVISCV